MRRVVIPQPCDGAELTTQYLTYSRPVSLVVLTLWWTVQSEMNASGSPSNKVTEPSVCRALWWNYNPLSWIRQHHYPACRHSSRWAPCSGEPCGCCWECQRPVRNTSSSWRRSSLGVAYWISGKGRFTQIRVLFRYVILRSDSNVLSFSVFTDVFFPRLFTPCAMSRMWGTPVLCPRFAFPKCIVPTVLFPTVLHHYLVFTELHIVHCLPQ